MRLIMAIGLLVLAAVAQPVGAQLAPTMPDPAGIDVTRLMPAGPATLAPSPAADPIITRDDVFLTGFFVLGALMITPIDRYYAERLQDPQNQGNRNLRISAESFNFIAYPGSLIIGGGLYVHGLARDDRETAALGLHGVEAILVGSAVAGVIKSVVGRARPYLDVTKPHDFGFMRGLGDRRYRSFPSGHTVAGFAAATVVTSETRRWWPNAEWYVAPIIMYGGAALIGVSRMYTNNHWASDVVIGAAIGTLAGVLIERWHRENPDNWIDDRLLPTEGDGGLQAAPQPLLIVWSIPMPR